MVRLRLFELFDEGEQISHVLNGHALLEALRHEALPCRATPLDVGALNCDESATHHFDRHAAGIILRYKTSKRLPIFGLDGVGNVLGGHLLDAAPE
jgi:hypothetical protein